MKRLTFELGLSQEGVFDWSHCRVLSMQSEERNQWQIQGVGPGIQTPPIRTDACLSSIFLSKAVFSAPTVTCVHGLRNTCWVFVRINLPQTSSTFISEPNFWTPPPPSNKKFPDLPLETPAFTQGSERFKMRKRQDVVET